MIISSSMSESEATGEEAARINVTRRRAGLSHTGNPTGGNHGAGITGNTGKKTVKVGVRLRYYAAPRRVHQSRTHRGGGELAAYLPRPPPSSPATNRALPLSHSGRRPRHDHNNNHNHTASIDLSGDPAVITGDQEAREESDGKSVNNTAGEERENSRDRSAEEWRETGPEQTTEDSSPARFDFEEYFGLVSRPPPPAMDSLAVQESKSAAGSAGSSPWLQFHLGQSHGFYGTSQKLNVRKENANNNNSGGGGGVVNGGGDSHDISGIMGTTRPVLQKSHSSLEGISTRPYSTTAAAPGRPKMLRSRTGSGGGVGSPTETHPLSYENLWWIARGNDKVVGGGGPGKNPTSGARPWETEGNNPPSAAAMMTSSTKPRTPTTLPSVTAAAKLPPPGPVPSSQQLKEDRRGPRSAQNRLLGMTRADHGLPLARKTANNNYIDLRYPDTIKLGRLGELSRLQSTLGVSVTYRHSNADRETKISFDLGGGDVTAPGGGVRRLQPFGIHKVSREGSGFFSELGSRPRTAPDMMERLPSLPTETDAQNQEKPDTTESGENNNVEDTAARQVDNDTPALITGDTGKSPGVATVNQDVVKSGEDSRVPEVNKATETPLKSMFSPRDTIAGETASTSQPPAANIPAANLNKADDSKLSRANLSMSNFFCISVDPKSLRNSGVCVFSGTTNRQVQFVSAEEQGEGEAGRGSRRVRFSVTNEIHEYRPWEAIGEQEREMKETAAAPTPQDPTNKVQVIDFPKEKTS